MRASRKPGRTPIASSLVALLLGGALSASGWLAACTNDSNGIDIGGGDSGFDVGYAEDAPVDSGSPDVARADTGADAALGHDAGVDSATVDSSVSDSAPEAAAQDSGSDAGAADSAVNDSASPIDSAVADANLPDAPSDASPDAGQDAGTDAAAGLVKGVYVGFGSGGQVNVYAKGGSLTPIAVYDTGADDVASLGFDAAGNLYIFSLTSTATSNNAILVFPPTADLSHGPGSQMTQFIQGTTTQLSHADASQMVVGPGGDIYVSMSSGSLQGAIVHFSPGANGDVAPGGTLAPSPGTSGQPDQWGTFTGVFGASGSTAYLASTAGSTVIGAVGVFSLGSTGVTNPSSYFCEGSATSPAGIPSVARIAGDSAGDSFILTQTDLFEFPASASGPTSPTWDLTIPPSSASTFAVDSSNYVYVPTGSGIDIYAAGSSTSVGSIPSTNFPTGPASIASNL